MQENISMDTAQQDSVYGKTLIVPLAGLEKDETWQVVIFSALEKQLILSAVGCMISRWI